MSHSCTVNIRSATHAGIQSSDKNNPNKALQPCPQPQESTAGLLGHTPSRTFRMANVRLCSILKAGWIGSRGGQNKGKNWRAKSAERNGRVWESPF